MRKAICVIVILVFSFFSLSGCWDSADIELLHIVTGIALDVNEEDESLIDISLQIANIQSGGVKDESSSDAAKPIIVKKTAPSISTAFKILNRESNRIIFLHHVEMLLFSVAVAELGINDHIDFFLRDTQSRLEISIALVDGRAEDVLKADLQQENQSTLYLANAFQRAKKISVEINMRLIDLIFKIANPDLSTLVPTIKLTKVDENDEINFTGYTIIKNFKAISMIGVEDVFGFLFIKSKTKNVITEVMLENGESVVFNITAITPKTKIELKDGKIKVVANINGEATIAEIKGFETLETKEQMDLFTKLLTKNVERRILNTFEIAKDNKSDFYGFCETIYRNKPSYWTQIKDNWDEYFTTIHLDLNVKMKITSTGQVSHTVEMEQKENAKR